MKRRLSMKHVSGATPAAALVALVALAGCGGTTGLTSILVQGQPANNSSVETVQISPDTLKFSSLAQTSQLSATALDTLGNEVTGVSFAWASSDGTIASVDQTGQVTSIGAGEATITATVGQVSGTATVIVTNSGTP